MAKRWALKVVVGGQKDDEEREARREAAWERSEQSRRGDFGFQFRSRITEEQESELRRRFPHGAYQD